MKCCSDCLEPIIYYSDGIGRCFCAYKRWEKSRHPTGSANYPIAIDCSTAKRYKERRKNK